MATRVEAPPDQAGASLETAALTADRVGRRFGDVTALDGMSLSVRAGEAVAVVGPSGCGKSTLLELLAGLQEPDAGSVSAGGDASAAARLRACAFMPQGDLLLPWRDALSNAGLALECAGSSRAAARRAAAPLFERFGLGEFEHAYPRELSGGMRQRVAFLRTLLAGRPALLLDEPFGALDSITRASMQEWLAGALGSEPRTLVLVTHDVEEALYLADRVLVMSPRPGRVVAEITVPFQRPRPRRETVTGSEFSQLRERAMEALGQ
jgi:NitT/TauT family transport system ATP-binding protein